MINETATLAESDDADELDDAESLLDEHAASNNEAAPRVATARMRRREMRFVIDISPLVGGLAHIGCGQEYSSRKRLEGLAGSGLARARSQDCYRPVMVSRF